MLSHATVVSVLCLGLASGNGAGPDPTAGRPGPVPVASDGPSPGDEHAPADASGLGRSLSLLDELAWSQDRLQDLGETVVTATRVARDPLDAPVSTAAVEREQVQRRGYRTLPQVLRDLPGVMVQETAPGQGSPFIRGFTGFRTLFLIDGIRLNNSVFRDGPNQYWGTVDANAFGRFELVKGPASSLYGSDAIGGTLNALPREPDPAQTAPVAGRIDYRYGDGERSHQGRFELDARLGPDTTLLLGGTLKDFGDFEGGSNVGRLENTGYDETAADLRLEHWLSDGTRLTIAHQSVQQDDVPRTHSTRFAESWKGTSVGSDRRRDLDQNRALSYARIEGHTASGGEPFALFDTWRATVSWHAQDETQTRVRSSGARQVSSFDVGTLGLSTQFGRDGASGEWTYGFDAYRDEVDSSSNTNPVQGPVADDSTYDTLGLYVQDRIEVDPRLELTLGARFEYAAADSDRVSDPITGNPTSLNESWDQLVGSARFLYRLAPDAWHLFGGVSQGFRAPNLSDLTRFDAARSNEFEIPSPGLDPETFVSFELGVRAEGDRSSAEVACFYTDISDLIVRFPTGNTNAAGEFEITKDNVGDGWVWGIELGGAYELLPEWTVFGDATFIEGRQETFPSSAQALREEHLDRLMPLTGRLGVRWERGDTWFEAVTIAAEKANRLSTRDRADTQRIPPGGTPGYGVLHLAAGHRLNDAVRVRIGLDNLFDEDYRVHGSGTNMPGRNLIVGLGMSF